MKTIIILIVCISILYLLGCYRDQKPPRVYIMKTCPYCKGGGKIEYGPDHWMVSSGMLDEGIKECSECEGSGSFPVEYEPTN